MLRQSNRLYLAVAAAALLCGTPSLAQGKPGLAGQLETAEAKLTSDSQSCTPINIGEYQSLLNEAAKNKRRAEKAKKAGAPVDETQINADLAKASDLFNRAVAAHVQQCVRQAGGQGVQIQPQPQPAEAQPQQSSSQLSPFANEMLAAHNAARAAVGAPPLKWNSRFEADATDRARQNAQAGQLVHASREGRGTVRENILRAPAGYSTAQIVDRWTRESAQFVPGIFPNVCNTGDDCSGILHYSQIIWPETTDVGCGKWPSGADVWVVCRLDPGGNKDGKPVGLPVQIAQNETIRPRLVGGDYGHTPAAVGTTVNTAPLFDLGIYAGGAWTTDWFNVADEAPTDQTSALSFMINGMLDFGDDDGVSGFVGGGVGVARVDYKNIGVFSNLPAGIDDSDVELARQLLQLGCSPTGNYCDTNVFAPTMPGTEVFKPNQVATSDKQEPSNPYQSCAGIRFWDAEQLYKGAQSKGDQAGMLAAKGLMAAAIGRQWQTMEHSTEAGEMVSVSRYSLGDFLGKMMDAYKDLTGELPPGYYESPNGYTTDILPPDPAAPALPASEVFNSGTAPNCPLDVM